MGKKKKTKATASAPTPAIAIGNKNFTLRGRPLKLADLLHAINQGDESVWIRAADGTRAEEKWIPVTDQGMVAFLCSWAPDASGFLVEYRKPGDGSPNSKPSKPATRIKEKGFLSNSFSCSSLVIVFKRDGAIVKSGLEATSMAALGWQQGQSMWIAAGGQDEIEGCWMRVQSDDVLAMLMAASPSTSLWERCSRLPGACKIHSQCDAHCKSLFLHRLEAAKPGPDVQCPFTQESEVPGMIYLPTTPLEGEGSRWLGFTAESLLQFLRQQFHDKGVLLSSVMVGDEHPLNVPLTSDHWHSCLLRNNPCAMEFQELYREWSSATNRHVASKRSISRDLKLRLLTFLSDLKDYNKSTLSEECINAGMPTPGDFFGSPIYFTRDEADLLNSIITPNGQILAQVIAIRFGSDSEYAGYFLETCFASTIVSLLVRLLTVPDSDFTAKEFIAFRAEFNRNVKGQVKQAAAKSR